MGRKWLLQVLAGVTMSLGLMAAPAAAQELVPAGVVAGQESSDPVTVDVPGGLGSVSVTPDVENQTLTVEVAPQVSSSAADTTVAPTVTAQVSPTGPAVDVSGPTEVAGTDLPVGSATEPVEEAVGRPPASAPAAPDVVDDTTSQAATSSPVASAPAPAEAPEVAERRSTSVPAGVSRGRATVASSPTDAALVDDTLAPQIAPAAVTREAPTQLAALPIVDTTPDVPALLRLMTGLMVLGAGMTWRSVKAQLQI